MILKPAGWVIQAAALRWHQHRHRQVQKWCSCVDGATVLMGSHEVLCFLLWDLDPAVKSHCSYCIILCLKF